MDYREYFPTTKKYIYLNHAGVSPLNTYTLKYTNAFIEDALINGGNSHPKWMHNVKEAKSLSARIINAHPDEMAILKNTTSGMLTVANGLKFNKGDNIIIPEKEFPANVHPWLNLQKKGVNVKFVKWRDGRILIEDILNLIDERTRLVSVSYVQFLNGYRINLEELGHHLKKRNVLFFADVVQGMGVFDIDVKRDNIDFLSAGAHKWLLGAEGVGFFYCKNDNLDMLDVHNLGYASVVAEDYLDYSMTLKPNSSRFEEGCANMLGIHTTLGSLKLIEGVTVAKIRERILDITDYFAESLKNEGFDIKSPREHEGEKSGIVSFYSKKIDSKELFKKLTENNCYVALRDNAIRISPHFYNSKEEVARFMEILSSPLVGGIAMHGQG